jgi:hypothetical protein
LQTQNHWSFFSDSRRFNGWRGAAVDIALPNSV